MSAALLELRLGELQQMFNSMDPAPFRERDLDPKVADYLVESAEGEPKGQSLVLQLQLDREPATADNALLLQDAVRDYFRRRSAAKWRDLSRLFRIGRISLLIGLAFLAVAIVAAEALSSLFSKENYATLVSESLIIGGWVALWRPIEIFLYDWWPIRAEARLYDRMGEMEVRMHRAGAPHVAMAVGP